jgi:hypothetical protein
MPDEKVPPKDNSNDSHEVPLVEPEIIRKGRKSPGSYNPDIISK